MTLTELSEDIFLELGEPTDISEAEIAVWLENNYGQLNILINETISLVSGDFDPELSIERANIFKLMYFIKYYSKLISFNLGASAYDWSEISEGDSKIRRVSKNEIAKNYKQLRDSYNQDLKDLVFYYKNNQVEPHSWDFDIYTECDE